MKTWKITCLAVLALLSAAIAAILIDQRKTSEAEARNREFDRAYDRTKASLDRVMAKSARQNEILESVKRSQGHAAAVNEMGHRMKMKLEESKAVTAQLNRAEPGSLEHAEARGRLQKILDELKSMQAQFKDMQAQTKDMQAELKDMQAEIEGHAGRN
jgi:chromosome segregation ATPase